MALALSLPKEKAREASFGVDAHDYCVFRDSWVVRAGEGGTAVSAPR